MKRPIKYSEKFLRFLPAIGFATLVFGPFVFNFFVSNSEILDNRPLNKKPTQIDKNFPLMFDNYYNDTFAYRKNFIKLYNRMRKNSGLSQNEIVIEGSDGWLFFDSFKKSSADNSVGDFLGAVYFTPEQKDLMAKNLAHTQEYFKEQSAKYFLFLAPNKENIYSENMPLRLKKARVSEVSRMDDAATYIKNNTNVNLFSLKALLLAEKDKTALPLYYKSDTHWNEVGAYLAFDFIAKTLTQNGLKLNYTPYEKMVFKLEPRESGDLGRMINSKRKEFKYLYNTPGEYACESKDEDQKILKCTSNGKTAKRMLVIRDSFGIALIPTLSKLSAETMYLRNPSAQEIKDAAQAFKPDLVVEIKVERSFPSFMYRAFN